jgi:hypothetical protein
MVVSTVDVAGPAGGAGPGGGTAARRARFADMAPRLKVFRWSDGFHAFSVAATSRPKALEAWGSRQDLFASGLAEEIREGEDYEAALARPGEVVERGLVIDVAEIKPKPRSRTARKSAADAARRRRVEAAEARLAEIDASTRELLASFDARIAQLSHEREKVSAKARLRRHGALKAIRKARASG